LIGHARHGSDDNLTRMFILTDLHLSLDIVLIAVLVVALVVVLVVVLVKVPITGLAVS
jgi:hypothetical protein